MCVIALLHESRDPRAHELADGNCRPAEGHGRCRTAGYRPSGYCRCGRGIERVRQLANLDAQAPADPLLEEGGPRLPATSSRAFWIGSVVVCLSLVSALATYLILTGLTPIAPRNEVVLGVLFVNVVLIIAMIAVIAWQVDRPAGAPGAARSPARGCTSASSLLFTIIAALPALLLAVGRHHDLLALARRLVLRRTRAIVDELARRRQRLPRRARPGDPHRHRQHGAATSTMRPPRSRRRSAQVPRAGDRAGRPARSAGRLHHRRQGQREGGGARGRAAFPTSRRPSTDRAGRGGAGAAADAVEHAIRVGADRQARQLSRHAISTSRAASARRSSSICSAPSRTSTSTSGCARRAAVSSSRTASCTSMISMTALLAAIWVGLWFAGRFVAPIRRLIAAAQEVSTRQSDGRAAREARRGRPAAAVADLQHHDARAEAPARRPRHRQRAADRAAPLHGGGAVGRLGRRHRPRQPGPHHARQPRGREAARPSRGRRSSARSSRMSCRSSRAVLDKARRARRSSRARSTR